MKLIGLPCPRCSSLINKQVNNEKYHTCEKCGSKIKISEHEHLPFEKPDIGPKKPEKFKVYRDSGGYSYYGDPDEDYSYNPY